ncbi:DUF2971 domain-containing protein [Chromobacterium phragmitis]|uniref:DUF2971 domain-containing protein n=1 Tax=Chromobacterium phragmitis TaxID=2202141 RepID=A0ABV0IR52_9NEIS
MEDRKPELKSIFKYASAEAFDKIFPSNKHVVFKLSLPKDFNDPYELSLTIDFNQPPDILACYQEVIGKIQQIPTTCFSELPSIIPMWAHYAKNSTGFSIELDVDLVKKELPEAAFNFVSYRDEPSDTVLDHLYKAARIGKFRHIGFLNDAVYHAAYFTKTKCWDCEKEVRMVINEKHTRIVDGDILIDIPIVAVKRIICGQKTANPEREKIKNFSKENGIGFYDLRIGRLSATPYFIDEIGNSHIFDLARNAFLKSKNQCENCKEPISQKEGSHCPWCKVEDHHRVVASSTRAFG